MASSGGRRLHSRQGPSSRLNNAQSEELQLRVDPIHGDFDDTISDLHHKVLGLKNVAHAIESETKFQNDFLSQLAERGLNFICHWITEEKVKVKCEYGVDTDVLILCHFLELRCLGLSWIHLAYDIPNTGKQRTKEMTMLKAQAGVKNNMRRLNRSIIQHGSSHVVYVITFGLLIFFVLYLLSKLSRR